MIFAGSDERSECEPLNSRNEYCERDHESDILAHMSKDEILEVLALTPGKLITETLTLSWHHQFKARQRVPKVMDRWEVLMKRWLTSFDHDDAAEIIILIAHHDLDVGPLPEDYHPEVAKEAYDRFLRNEAEHRHMRMLAGYGANGQTKGLGRSINIG